MHASSYTNLPQRGGITATLNGEKKHLLLTLGALAELENALEEKSLPALITRLTQGELKSAEILAIIKAGLKGAGHDITDNEMMTMTTDNGILGLITIAQQLLAQTFDAPQST